jgi:hypothetical protein
MAGSPVALVLVKQAAPPAHIRRAWVGPRDAWGQRARCTRRGRCSRSRRCDMRAQPRPALAHVRPAARRARAPCAGVARCAWRPPRSASRPALERAATRRDCKQGRRGVSLRRRCYPPPSRARCCWTRRALVRTPLPTRRVRCGAGAVARIGHAVANCLPSRCGAAASARRAPRAHSPRGSPHRTLRAAAARAPGRTGARRGSWAALRIR